jgi:lysophospholipase L1-like esterase
MKRILCFGDSNTWGYIPGTDGERYGPEERWPGVAAAAGGPGFQWIEEGQNGRTTMWDDPAERICKNGLRHLPVLLETHKPLDLVILMLGTNDLKNHLGRRAGDIAQGMMTLAERVMEDGVGPGGAPPAVLVVAPVPLATEPCPFPLKFDGARERSLALAEGYRKVAAWLGVSFLDAGAHAICPSPDSIHLDAAGHRALGTAMAAAVRDLIS